MQTHKGYTIKTVQVNKLLLSVCLLLWASVSYAQQFNYNQHIAPIIYKNCSPCHHRGQPTPFDLLSYTDVVKQSATIKQVVQKNLMPPWAPNPNYTHFTGERILSDKDKKALIAWIDKGMPEGLKKDAPKAPVFIGGSYYGKPDTSIAVMPFNLKAGQGDVFREYTINIPKGKAQYLKSIEFSPGDLGKYIHHCNMEFSILDFDSMKVRKVFFSGWTPGYFSPPPPQGIGIPFTSDGLLRLNLHFSNTPVDVSIQSYINLHYATEPITRTIAYLTVGGVDELKGQTTIPADTVITYHVTKKVEQDITAFTLYPHMHIFGKAMQAYAVSPTNDTIKLIDIPQWVYEWQEVYAVAKPFKIPANSVIHLFCTYDNTANNPLNPNSPSKPIAFEADMTSANEMINLFIQYAPYQPGDESLIMTDITNQ